MARTKSVSNASIDLAKVKADLQKAGVPAEHIRSFTADLVQKVTISNLEQERDELKSRLETVNSEIARLKGAPARGRRGRPAASKTTGAKRGRRRSKVSPETILELLQANKGEGFRREQLATALNVQSKTLLKPITALLDEKRIKRKGQKRGTTYYV